MCKWRIEWGVYRVTKWNACFNLCSKAQNKCKVTWDQAPHCGEKAKKLASKASPEVIWGGERMAEPGDMLLMPPIHPAAINLSLTCQHVIFSSRMSAWAYYVGFCKKYLNSRWSKLRRREIRMFQRKMCCVWLVKNLENIRVDSQEDSQVSSVCHDPF